MARPPLPLLGMVKNTKVPNMVPSVDPVLLICQPWMNYESPCSWTSPGNLGLQALSWMDPKLPGIIPHIFKAQIPFSRFVHRNLNFI